MEYRLDLNTLLLMLKQSTGNLYAEVQHIPGVKGRCQVFLRLEQGLIQSCGITNEYGAEVGSGAAAVKQIQSLVLEWHYKEEKAPTQTLPSTPAFAEISPYLPRETAPRFSLMPAVRSPIPLRRYTIGQRDFLSWPRLYRSVYSLIDGKSSVDDIVRLLVREQSKERVLEVIEHLQREGLIVFDSGTRNTGWL